MTRREPLELLPHRPPFVFVDKILEVEQGQRAVGSKFVSPDESYLRGHFPGNPLMPGVLITEALAQVAGIALNSQFEHGRQTYLSAIRSMKFRQPVLPGQTMKLSAIKQSQLGDLSQFSVTATVGDTVVAEGEVVLGWTR